MIQTLANPAPLLKTEISNSLWRRRWVQSVVIVALVFAAIAPFLDRCELCGGMENFCVATAMEAARDGHWLVPTLNGEVRTKKPPLAQWITAIGLKLGGEHEFAARWPCLLLAAATIAVVIEWGFLIGGRTLGVVSGCVFAGNILFIKFAWTATYDTPLMLFVIAANYFLNIAIIKDKWLWPCAAAGLSLGLALMSKGPPALLQVIVPPVALTLWWRWHGRAMPWSIVGRSTPRQRAVALAVGAAVALAVALPWTLWIFWKFPGRLTEWYGEVTLSQEARLEKRMGWHSYFVLIPFLFPWSLWFLAGLWNGVRDVFQKTDGAGRPSAANVRMPWITTWLLLPIVVMVFFPERRDRYLLPMLGPAAILIAWTFLRMAEDARPMARKWFNALTLFQWLGLAAMAIVLPLAGALWLKTADQTRWYPPLFAVVAALVGLFLVALAARGGFNSISGLAGGSLALVLLFNGLFLYGYGQSDKGRSSARPLADSILRAYPTARVLNGNMRKGRSDVPLELTVYLDQAVVRYDEPGRRPASDRPIVVIFPASAPPALPANAQPLANAVIKGEPWEAYVLPASGERYGALTRSGSGATVAGDGGASIAGSPSTGVSSAR
jgi:4-amino-4-deoxy-L-arabinose transferase-like glycosyltransferase